MRIIFVADELDKVFLASLKALKIKEFVFITEDNFEEKLSKAIQEPLNNSEYAESKVKELENKEIKKAFKQQGKKTDNFIVEQMKVVEREKLLGTGYICVAGGNRGSGSTTVALSIANYLAKKMK